MVGKRKAFYDMHFVIYYRGKLQNEKNPFPKNYHLAYTKGVQDLLAEVIKGDSILHELFDQQQLRLLISSGGSVRDTMVWSTDGGAAIACLFSPVPLLGEGLSHSAY